MSDLKTAALEYHAQPRPGKLSVELTKATATARDLSLAYSPGVAYPCLDIEADPALAGALGDEGYVGTLFALDARADSTALAAEIAAALDGTEGVFGGAAPLASGHGAVARFLAADAPALRLASYRAWDAARRRMRGRPAPILRK